MELSRLIDFDRVDVISQMIYPPRPVLVVSGVPPTPGTTVTLVPLMYISRPQYYGIQVVGTIENIARPPGTGPAEYRVELDLTGIIGTEGIEVIGATRTERVAMPAPEPTEETS